MKITLPITCPHCRKRIYEEDVVHHTQEEQPILIGHTGKKNGMLGFQVVEIGAPVYLYEGKYFFEMEKTNDKSIQRFYFYPHSIKENSIVFLKQIEK